jgi:5-oxoprolinase (ATP-hydrolysing) subunit A
VGYVKAHGALANLAAADRDVAEAVARAVRAVSRDLALLAISGTELEPAGHGAGLAVYSEVFADRAYRTDGQLVSRSAQGAVIHDAEAAAARLLGFLETGLMPVPGGPAIPLKAHSICVHGDTPGAVGMAQRIRAALTGAGVTIAPFLAG